MAEGSGSSGSICNTCITRRLVRKVVELVYGDNEMVRSESTTGTVSIKGRCVFPAFDAVLVGGIRTSATLSSDHATEIATICPRSMYAHT